MVCTVARASAPDAYGTPVETLKIAGANRRDEEWFGVEVDLTEDTEELSMTLRIYPAIRLFPRIHFDLGAETRHVDLPDVAASDSFATRHFQAMQWQSHIAWPRGARRPRMTLLVPSTPWFILEMMSIERRVSGDA